MAATACGASTTAERLPPLSLTGTPDRRRQPGGEPLLKTTSLYGPVYADLPLVDAALDSIRQTDFPALTECSPTCSRFEGNACGRRWHCWPATFSTMISTNSFPSRLLWNCSTPRPSSTTMSSTSAATRRGHATANSLYDNAASVMLGDLCLRMRRILGARTGNVRVIRLFSQTLMHMATGELDQDASAFDWSRTYVTIFGASAARRRRCLPRLRGRRHISPRQRLG